MPPGSSAHLDSRPNASKNTCRASVNQPTMTKSVASTTKYSKGDHTLTPLPERIYSNKHSEFSIELFMPGLFQRVPKILRVTEPSLLTGDTGAGLWAPDTNPDPAGC